MRRLWRVLTARRVESVPGVSASVVVSEAWRARELLTDANLADFIALRRVCGRPDSHVDQVGDDFYDAERRLLPHVEDGVTMLIEVGLATVGEPDPVYGRQRVTATPDGRARYEQLCEQQGYPPYPDPCQRLTGGDFK